jgi:hypothetical protein
VGKSLFIILYPTFYSDARIISENSTENKQLYQLVQACIRRHHGTNNGINLWPIQHHPLATGRVPEQLFSKGTGDRLPPLAC